MTERMISWPVKNKTRRIYDFVLQKFKELIFSYWYVCVQKIFQKHQKTVVVE